MPAVPESICAALMKNTNRLAISAWPHPYTTDINHHIKQIKIDMFPGPGIPQQKGHRGGSREQTHIFQKRKQLSAKNSHTAFFTVLHILCFSVCPVKLGQPGLQRIFFAKSQRLQAVFFHQRYGWPLRFRTFISAVRFGTTDLISSVICCSVKVSPGTR